MEETSRIVILITTSNSDEGQKIAELLLNQRLVACVNIVPKVNSFFKWQSKPDSAQESLLIIKTRKALLSEITETVKRIHSYEVPEIIALPITGGNEEYLEWIDNEVKEG